MTQGAKTMNLKELSGGAGRSEIYYLPLDAIAVDPDFNVRTDTAELREHIATIAASIKAGGFLSTRPMTVRLDAKQGKAVLVDGHCRYAAAKMAVADGAELKAVPCLSEGRGVSPEDRTLMLLTANSGLPLTGLEQAEAVKRLLAFGWSDAEIGRRIGRTRQHVANLLELAAAPIGIKKHVVNGTLSATAAVKLIRDEGAGAEAKLERVKATAAASGKVKVTPKMIAAAKPKPVKPYTPPGIEVVPPRQIRVTVVPLSVAAQHVVDMAKGVVLPGDLRRAIDALHLSLT